MGRRTKGKATVDPRKRKSRYIVKCPPYLAEGKELYEIPASDPDLLIDRIVDVPLYTLRGSGADERGLYVNVKLQVKRVSGQYAFTEFKGLYMLPEIVQSKVLRGTSRIDAIITLRTADNVLVRITTTIITAHRCRTKVKEDIRKLVFNYRSERVPKMTFEEFANFVISDMPEEEIAALAHKIFPIGEVILSKVKVLSDPAEREVVTETSSE